MFSAYDILKSTISSGGYKLAEVQGRIKQFFLLGDLDVSQMDELLAMAVGSASADAERPETLKLIQALGDRIAELESRVAVLESGNGDTENTDEVTFPEWKPWDGISTNYVQGAIVRHNGQLWESTFAGQNVWEPGVIGTESLWRKYILEGDAN